MFRLKILEGILKADTPLDPKRRGDQEAWNARCGRYKENEAAATWASRCANMSLHQARQHFLEYIRASYGSEAPAESYRAKLTSGSHDLPWRRCVPGDGLWTPMCLADISCDRSQMTRCQNTCPILSSPEWPRRLSSSRSQLSRPGHIENLALKM